MLWLFYVAWWTDIIGLIPGARPEARLLPVIPSVQVADLFVISPFR